MAGGRRKATSETAAADRKVTRRLVLQRVRAVVVPTDPAEPLATLLGEHEIEGVDVWVERGEFDGSQTGAIESFAGKPGTPDAKVGVFKAVPVRNWKGGARYSQPALPKVERELLP